MTVTVGAVLEDHVSIYKGQHILGNSAFVIEDGLAKLVLNVIFSHYMIYIIFFIIY